MSICSIKFWECDPRKHKYKGRICFRGDSVKDQDGAAAVFQELTASPTTVQSANSNIAYGCLEGNETQQADAVRAYVQALLKSKHATWVRIPKELWPEEWHKRGLRRPMCLLKKALYGHPESGAHWERHLHEAVVACGGKAIESHPSSYWFEKLKLLLTVYVDDLMLSGPKGNHKVFWAELSKRVDLDEPEALNRFLGRTHVVDT